MPIRVSESSNESTFYGSLLEAMTQYAVLLFVKIVSFRQLNSKHNDMVQENFETAFCLLLLQMARIDMD